MGRLTDAYRARVRAGELTDDPAQGAVAARLDRLAEEIVAWGGGRRGRLGRILRRRDPQAPRGLYVHGPVGRGKSMLMDLFHGALPAGLSRRVHFHAFMQDVHARLDRARRAARRDPVVEVAVALAREARVLCLDEMEIRDIADAMIVGRLFALLLDGGTVVVTTSNRPPEDLYRNGLNRDRFEPFITLIRTRLEVIEIGAGADWRGLAGGAGSGWLAPATAEMRARFEALWQGAGGGRAGPGTIRVHGREVRLPRLAGGLARAGFWDLCGRALGTADYLALAERIDWLFLEEVPRLSRRNFNEARRFVLLIDALYEAGVRLVALAADRPENLYLEGEGAFEFARTASRLKEMTRQPPTPQLLPAARIRPAR